jgi:AcrR family transcriptional regulator
MLYSMSSKKIETRTKILQATMEALEQHPGQSVRMGDIARGAGISRQALYLHFPSRTELLIEATLYKEELLDVERRLEPSRAAPTGKERLGRYIEFWGGFIPEIYPVGKSLMMAQDTDEDAAAAWRGRMEAMKDGCRAAIEDLYRDGDLADEWTRPKAIDTLWTMLLVPNWEHLTQACGWSPADYTKRMKIMARRLFVA